MSDQVFIQVRFSINRDGLDFSDALVLTQDEYNSLTPDQIEQMKSDRFENWKTMISTPPVQNEVPVTDQIVATVDQINTLTDTLTQLNQQAQDNNLPSLPDESVQAISDNTDVLVQQVQNIQEGQ